MSEPIRCVFEGEALIEKAKKKKFRKSYDSNEKIIEQNTLKC